jgi:hypothetical protein
LSDQGNTYQAVTLTGNSFTADFEGRATAR